MKKKLEKNFFLIRNFLKKSIKAIYAFKVQILPNNPVNYSQTFCEKYFRFFFAMKRPTSVVDIVDQSGVQPLNEKAAPISPFGEKTNTRQYFKFRFSAELPSRSLFRQQMAPIKKRPTTTSRLVEKTSRELENTHMDTVFPPSIHVLPEEKQIIARAPCLVHGTLFREKHKSLNSINSYYVNTFEKRMNGNTFYEQNNSPNKNTTTPANHFHPKNSSLLNETLQKGENSEDQNKYFDESAPSYYTPSFVQQRHEFEQLQLRQEKLFQKFTLNQTWDPKKANEMRKRRHVSSSSIYDIDYYAGNYESNFERKTKPKESSTKTLKNDQTCQKSSNNRISVNFNESNKEKDDDKKKNAVIVNDEPHEHIFETIEVSNIGPHLQLNNPKPFVYHAPNVSVLE
ncbi:hypothetical protein TRFO_23520 [Tritrichomonas foetus]|uniref:Uncharacterized protein n=1 Tax=Tritrichomonas foetus TaxID=1144522 RepID=A0A1J4KEQ4_9EUKA|nr:hypothetical protein TRFO_23520 [Tritrichomonas foetus]|eukprot:OHT08078.1 hypothetical protein TRFO_23520 [Tritrichomonas foetus]